MRSKKYFPIYILILLAITIVYVLLAVKPLGKEYQFSPVWKISTSNPTIKEGSDADDKMYFKFKNSLGYFTKNGDVTLYSTFPKKAAISNEYYSIYDSSASQTPFYNNVGKELGKINASGYPYIKDGLIFVFLPGGATFAKCDNNGNLVWTYEGTLPITAFAAKEKFTAVGFANGLITIFDTETGELLSKYAPGGSDYPVILGLDISDDGQYIASVSGHEKQRFVLSKREKSQQKIIYHKFLDSNSPFRTLVHFCNDNDRIIYDYDENIGIYSILNDKNTEIPIKDKVIAMEESDTLVYLLSKNKNDYTVSIVENTNALEGSFNFKADSAFIKTVDNDLYIGKDNSISRINVTKE